MLAWKGQLFCIRSVPLLEGLPKRTFAGVGRIQSKGLGHPAEASVLQRASPWQPGPILESSEAAELSANVKADLSWQRPSLPVSLVSLPLWDVSPSAFKNAAIPIPFSPIAVSPGRSAQATLSDVSV